MSELSADGVDIRRADGSIYFWIHRGFLDDVASVRGEDDIIPSAAGMAPRPRIKHRRIPELRGQIKGADDAAYLALVAEVQDTLFNLAADPWPLVVADGYRGLGPGVTATLMVRTISVTPAADLLTYRRGFAFVLESVDSPPEWVIAP